MVKCIKGDLRDQIVILLMVVVVSVFGFLGVRRKIGQSLVLYLSISVPRFSFRTLLDTCHLFLVDGQKWLKTPFDQWPVQSGFDQA